MHEGPGKSSRKGLSVIDLMALFPTEEAATEWFEAQVWPDGRCCGHCGSTQTGEVSSGKPMPYWCRDCRSYFSVRTGTVIAHSKVPLKKWALGIYLELTSLKSISSMKLHRDIGVSQPTAWFMLHRIREAWTNRIGRFDGPLEADETYVGGLRKNMPKSKRKHLVGRGTAGKTAVAGVKDRATNRVSAAVVRATDTATLQDFVTERATPNATVYTDEASAYTGLPFDHHTVKHSVGEYVDGKVHVNGIESFWSMLKRAHKGTFHKISPKHLNRYVQEFAGKHNIRDLDTMAQMTAVIAALVGKRLLYRDLIADNGLDSGARK